MGVSKDIVVCFLFQICFIGNIICTDDELPKDYANTLCWMTEEYSTVGEECQQCQDLDYKLYNEACIKTGYKEKVKCESGTEAYKSCAKPSWINEKVFWALEGVMLVTGLSSCWLVHTRRKKIERDMMQRVQRQISAAV
ncbi:protein JTB-like [Saccoglossus kowalevskii]|uniref:Protein JTB-like n=1 Tax=Saccoglossus kowalevskii TaxID=10224 RepID=A0ABM0M3K7_SACKO|nr:PREDICTED: protein JTB-like [Saccoglossus kowalevskii]